MGYGIVLLDADNTLFDFSKSERKSIFSTYAELNLPCSEEKLTEYKKINDEIWGLIERTPGDNTPLLISRFEKIFKLFGDKADPKTANEIYRIKLSEGHDMLYGARKLLTSLYSSGKRMFLITNGIIETQRKRLKEAHLNKFFENVFISDEIGARKPTEEYFEYCAEKINGFDKKNSIVVGDSLRCDMLGGINFGVDTCWFNPSGKTNDLLLPVTYEVKTHKQVARIILNDSWQIDK